MTTRIAVIVALLLTSVCLPAQNCSGSGGQTQLCVSGSLTGYTGVSCACGITWDTNYANNPAGGEQRFYDVWWPTDLGVTNNLRQMWGVHGGGYAGKLEDSGDYPSAAQIDAFVKGQSGTADNANLYMVAYSTVALGVMTATAISGTSSILLKSQFCCGTYWWPTFSSSFSAVIDDGPNRETVTVSGMSGSESAATWTVSTLANTHPYGSFTLTSAGSAIGGHTTYTGTITGGGSNAFAGMYFNFTGFAASSGINNGTFLCSSSTATQLICDNPSGTSETHAGTATTSPYVYIPNFQWPLQGNDMASFASFLAQCSYGGATYHSGACASFADVPGNPLNISLFPTSAGGTYSLRFLQEGCNLGSTCPLLNNTVSTKGYTVWTNTGWAVNNPYGTALLGGSPSMDPALVFAQAVITDRNTGQLGWETGIALCGAIPTCNASYTDTTGACAAPSSAFTACNTSLGPISNSQGSQPMPIPGWGCAGPNDPDFYLTEVLMGTQTNFTTDVFSGTGHGCTSGGNPNGAFDTLMTLFGQAPGGGTSTTGILSQGAKLQ